MTYRKTRNGIVTTVPRKQNSFPPVISVRSKNQCCSQESDRRLREMIRGMDRREQLIVLDELQRIHDMEKKNAV